jgi:hypothetical protein
MGTDHRQSTTKRPLIGLVIGLLATSCQIQASPRSQETAVPRSQEIAFVITGPNSGPYPGPAIMYASALHGQHRRVLVPSDHESWYYGPSWSPDGSRFVYLSYGIHVGPCLMYVVIGRGAMRQRSIARGQTARASPLGRQTDRNSCSRAEMVSM